MTQIQDYGMQEFIQLYLRADISHSCLKYLPDRVTLLKAKSDSITLDSASPMSLIYTYCIGK
jgi:hypothetical protein